MTTQEQVIATERLRELERKALLPAETIRDLKAWWRSVLRREEHKIVSIAEWQKNKHLSAQW